MQSSISIRQRNDEEVNQEDRRHDPYSDHIEAERRANLFNSNISVNIVLTNIRSKHKNSLLTISMDVPDYGLALFYLV